MKKRLLFVAVVVLLVGILVGVLAETVSAALKECTEWTGWECTKVTMNPNSNAPQFCIWRQTRVCWDPEDPTFNWGESENDGICPCPPDPTPTPIPTPEPTPVPTPIPTPETKPAMGYVTIQGSAKTSLLIAKQWNGNSWQYPQYMFPENLNPPGPWSVHYILGAGVARFGLFERGTDHEQDQDPMWTSEVKVIAGKHLVVIVYDEELNLPDDKH